MWPFAGERWRGVLGMRVFAACFSEGCFVCAQVRRDSHVYARGDVLRSERTTEQECCCGCASVDCAAAGLGATSEVERRRRGRHQACAGPFSACQ